MVTNIQKIKSYLPTPIGTNLVGGSFFTIFINKLNQHNQYKERWDQKWK